jgi:hypothetical protein
MSWRKEQQARKEAMQQQHPIGKGIVERQNMRRYISGLAARANNGKSEIPNS